MTNSFLPPESQPWGREVEARLRALELQNSAANVAINGINATLSSSQQAIRSLGAQQELLSANSNTVVINTDLYTTAGEYNVPLDYTPLSPNGFVTIYGTPKTNSGLTASVSGTFSFQIGRAGLIGPSNHMIGPMSFAGGSSGGRYDNTLIAILPAAQFSTPSSVRLLVNIVGVAPGASVEFEVAIRPTYENLIQG